MYILPHNNILVAEPAQHIMKETTIFGNIYITGKLVLSIPQTLTVNLPETVSFRTFRKRGNI